MKLDKKKITVLVLGVLTLLVLIGSASYAYYSVSVLNNRSTTKVKGNTTAIDNIALLNTTNDMHITLTTKDMSLENKRDYYAVTEKDKNYEAYEHGIELAELEATGGDARTAYDCEVKVTVTKKDDDTMISTLEEGETELYITYGNVSETYDLFNLKNDKTKEFKGNITLINNSSDFIHSYLKVINNEQDQTHLAGKKLDIDIDTDVVKCEVIGTSKIELALRNTNTSNTLSKELKGGMFRYQGTANDVTDNYICFGTDDQQNCLNYQDQYMYRIIGVTPEGRLKLIKKEALEDTYKWWDNTEGDISFLESNIYKAISGDKFLTNSSYIPKGWEEKIYNNTWTYGDMLSEDTLGANQTGEELYLVETGKKGTIWDVKAKEGDEGAESVEVEYEKSSHKGEIFYYIRHNNEIRSKTFKGKVSLMYLHDYYLSVSDETNCQKSGNNYEACQNGWIHLSKNDSKLNSPQEWTMSRYGWDFYTGWVYEHYLNETGYVGDADYTADIYVRPVFYLNNDIEISGKGTTTEPYMIKLENE